MIPYGRQFISQADIDAVSDILWSDFLTQGPVVPQFEEAVAHLCGAEYGIALNSATSALHVACIALGLGPGDYLWTSPNTFVASANCALYCGASVDFVDIDSRTYNLDVEKLEEKLKEAARSKTLPKVVVAVDFAGQPADMRGIYFLSQKYGFRVIEDASHSIGSRYEKRPTGNCAHADITIFSFHPVKMITTGEGGMALTNDYKLASHMGKIRSHGITRNANEWNNIEAEPWWYEQQEIGFNYRMTDIAAALGLSQLNNLDRSLHRRSEIAATYNYEFSDSPVILPWQRPGAETSWHLYVIRVDPVRSRVSRRELYDECRRAEIGVNVHYIPVHWQPIYRKLGFRRGDYPQAEEYYASALSLPIYYGLAETQLAHVIATVKGHL